jgi:hypothetical protein
MGRAVKRRTPFAAPRHRAAALDRRATGASLSTSRRRSSLGRSTASLYQHGSGR